MSSGTVGIEYARLVQEDCARKVGSRVSFHAVDIRDLANTAIEQSEQIGKVRSAREKVRALWREAEENDSLPHHYREGYVDALDIAEGLLDQVLGDTDD